MPNDAFRLEKWLWHARFLRTRAAAARFCEAGEVRVNRLKVDKAHYAVRPGDVLTFVVGGQVRVVRVRALGRRRAPGAVARALYEDVVPPRLARPASLD
ncbi:MAG: S4 domain-containing protein [Alphaproteobacteria bacterium]